MSPTTPERESRSDVTRKRAAMRDLIPGLVALVVAEATLIAADPDATSSGWHLVWSLSPLIGIGMLAWGQVRILRRSDEWERLGQLSAMSIGFGVFAVLLAGVGVLQAAGIGDVVQLMQITFFAGIAAWVAALGITWSAKA
jgi:hypothetical protein